LCISLEYLELIVIITMTAIKSIGRDLSEPRSTPHLVFFIKGDKHAGKSTLMNALFCRNFIRRPDGVEEPQVVTVCNDNTAQSPVKSEYRNIRVSHSILEGLFAVNHKVEYIFIDTTSATSTWFELNTKLCNGVILVIDKDKLNCDKISQQLLSSTLRDLAKYYRSSGFTLPLIIIVNKVDDCDDSEVLERIELFEQFVLETVRCSEHPDQSVGFVFMSALDIYLYRTFALTGTFERFDTRDVSRLCGMELGAEGKALARDHSKYPELEEAVRGRALSETGNQRWKLHCGVDRLMAKFDELVFAERCMSRKLEKQVSLHLDLFDKHSVSSNRSSSLAYSPARNILSPTRLGTLATVTQTPPRNTELSSNQWLQRMRFSLEIYNQYALVLSHDPSDMIYIAYRKSISQLCQERYRGSRNGYVVAVCSSPGNITGASDPMAEFVRHKYSDTENLFSAEDWEEMRNESILRIINLVWTGTLLEDRVTAARITVGMVESGMNLPIIEELIKLVAEMPTATATTLMVSEREVNNDEMKSYVESSSSSDVIDITTLTSSSEDERTTTLLPNRIWQGGRQDTVLTYLENRILPMIEGEGFSRAKMAFLDAMIRKKLSIRQVIPGYTVCLRELLNKYPSAKEKLFSLFFPVLHGPIPTRDVEWGSRLPRELNYENDILGSPLLTSERVLVESIPSGQALSSTSTVFTSTETPLPKRRRVNSPQTVQDDDSSSTHSSGQNTQPGRIVTPSRRRIIMKFGEC